MNPHRKWIAAIGCMFLAVAVATSQEKKDAPHSGVGVKLEVLDLSNGLPEHGVASAFPVGSGAQVVYLGIIKAHSRWLSGNAIEVTLEITKYDKGWQTQTETILLDGFEPKIFVMREDPAHGRRELLRLIPVSKQVLEGLQYYP